jgi:8-oxo-dGTP diphosphatase
VHPDGAAPERERPDVLAAGAVVWREGRDGRTEVLLVHRPRYDDWSWPKGKAQRGEPLAECAVREVGEETGTAVVLGRPLPATTYRLPDGRTKLVRYWAARPAPSAGSRGQETDAEVDRTEWLEGASALGRLTRPGDRAPLERLLALAAEGTLDTVPVVVARHGTARPRDSWSRAEGDRPLVAAGRRQSLALASLLRCWRPERVLSSPWRRCLDTVRPYLAASSGTTMRTKAGLSESGHRRHPEKAARHTERLLRRGRPALLCTHRPVLPAVLRALAAAATPEVRSGLPVADPWLAPGEALVAHVARSAGRPLVVAVERHLGTR